jgi:hypothetical protein
MAYLEFFVVVVRHAVVVFELPPRAADADHGLRCPPGLWQVDKGMSERVGESDREIKGLSSTFVELCALFLLREA